MKDTRTLQGPMTGEVLTIGYRDGAPVRVTIWDGILFTKRNLPPDWPAFRRWGDAVCIGGLWWREIPHPIQRNATSMAYYPDTLRNALTRPVRAWLTPGLRPEQRAWRWLKGVPDGNS